jgi:selenide,water dikinase
MGGTPMTALNLACFPDNELPLSLLGTILQGGASKCMEAGCSLMGGHTVRDKEIKYGLSVTGTIHPKQIWTNAAAQPGDALVLLKPLGTGFVTTAAKKQQCPQDTLDAAIHSMTTLNKASAELCREFSGVHAVTDITGFGLAGHSLVMALGSKVSLEIDLNQLPLLPGVLDLVRGKYFTRARASNRNFVQNELEGEASADADLVEIFLDAQTSGGFLVSIENQQLPAFLKQARAKGTLAQAPIGCVTARQHKALILKN